MKQITRIFFLKQKNKKTKKYQQLKQTNERTNRQTTTQTKHTHRHFTWGFNFHILEHQ